MKLYQLPFSHYSAKARIVLLEKQISVDLPDLPGGSPESNEYRQINPNGLVPCLIDENLVIAESEVIAEYLNDAYPQPAMLPASAAQRARSRWLSRMHDLQLAPRLTQLYGLSLAEKADQMTIESVLTELFEQLDQVEASIDPAPYFFGEQFGISDASFVLSTWYAMILSEAFGSPLTDQRFPKLIEWFDNVSTRKSAHTVLTDCKQALGMLDAQDRRSA